MTLPRIGKPGEPVPFGGRADLWALVPVIRALSGVEACAATARAIQDVTRWRP
ncbi:MAG: hypothetical protein KatS3mg049_3691 [Caldilinea sp.]|jgi:hypothetical protein|nr:MAG: hypothetical protein KatS3mg049_3691 [Caldilinea sp.]